MAVEIIPIKHGWETLLDKYVILVKDALATNDFGIIHNIIADEQLSGIDHSATFHNHIDRVQLDQAFHEVPDDLNAINAKAVQSGLDSYQEFHNTVENLKDKPSPTPYAAPGGNGIEDAAELAQNAAQKAIDDATEAAKNVIRRLPDEAQEAASNVFGSGFKAVQGFLGNVGTQIRAVVQNPVASLEKAGKAVAHAAQTAWNWLKGAFTYSATLSGTVSGHNKAGQSASLGLHATKEGHSHSVTHGGENDQVAKRTGN